MSSAPKSQSPEPATVESFWAALAPAGNTCDGHIVEAVLRQIKRINGTEPEILIADNGYRGRTDFGKTRLLNPSAPHSSDSAYKKRKQRQRFRKRAGIEATISHIKQDFRLGRCFLKGEKGDEINVTLASTDGYQLLVKKCC